MRVLWSEGSHFEFVWFLNEWVAQIWLGVGLDVHTSVLHSETEDALSSCWCYDMLIISKLLWEKKETWGGSGVSCDDWMFCLCRTFYDVQLKQLTSYQSLGTFFTLLLFCHSIFSHISKPRHHNGSARTLQKQTDMTSNDLVVFD